MRPPESAFDTKEESAKVVIDARGATPAEMRVIIASGVELTVATLHFAAENQLGVGLRRAHPNDDRNCGKPHICILRMNSPSKMY